MALVAGLLVAAPATTHGAAGAFTPDKPSPSNDAAPRGRAPSRELRVFAAASLAEAFGELSRAFQRAHPDVVVRINLAGSQQLVAQIGQGATADVMALADERWMEDLSQHGMLSGDPVPFARNRLIVIVPRTNPARIKRLQDLARPGVKLVIGAPAVPVGAYAREMLSRLSRQPGFASDFARRVLSNVVSEEESVRGVVGKVQLGEADAGIAYRSDVSHSVARYLRVLQVPDSANVTARYPIAVLAGAPQAALAREFVAQVLSPEGQRTLARHGFETAPATP